MSDQLSGVWFSHLIGFNSALPADRVRAALGAVIKYNFNPEQGLVNATYPPGRSAYEPTFGNPQAVGNWTGIEYASAALALDFGLVPEGLAIIRAVGDRYLRAGRCWNHVECGDHYYRAMSSWTTLLALTGFKIDAPEASLSILPVVRQPKLRAPWVTSTSWGFLEIAREKSLLLNTLSGELSFQRLKINLPGRDFRVELAGRRIKPIVTVSNGATLLDFGQVLQLQPNQPLIVKS
jgi:uncharacterized protein (DUF608 family)